MLERHPDYTEDEWGGLTPAARARCWRATGLLVSAADAPAEDRSYLAMSGAARMSAACELSMLVHDSVAPGQAPWMLTRLARGHGRLVRLHAG